MSKQKLIEMQWKVHTPNLLNEVLSNPSTSMLHRPLQLLGERLHAMAERAAELNDPALNAHMMALTLYEVADPRSEAYDSEIVREYAKILTENIK